MRLPVSHIFVYQGCSTFITEGPNAVKWRQARNSHLRFIRVFA